jgi:hypothetical protein
MRFEDFEQLQEQLFAQLKHINKTKGIEYRATDDQLSTFKQLGDMLSIPPETVVMVLAAKHWQSIVTYSRDLLHGVERDRSEPMQGRFLDIIQYMMLMEALRVDRTAESLPVLGRKERALA